MLMTGGIGDESPSEQLQFLIDQLKEEYGVPLSDQQFIRLSELFMALNNRSHLWQTFGWSPEELYRLSPPTGPTAITIGANMKRMFASGEMDKDEFVRKLKELGIQLIDD